MISKEVKFIGSEFDFASYQKEIKGYIDAYNNEPSASLRWEHIEDWKMVVKSLIISFGFWGDEADWIRDCVGDFWEGWHEYSIPEIETFLKKRTVKNA